MGHRTFITCAVTGAGDGHERNPHVPSHRTNLRRRHWLLHKVAAAIVRIDVRDPETKVPSRDD